MQRSDVLFVYLDGTPLWLRRMNTEPLYDAFFTWLRDTLTNGAMARLPASLTARSFRWTGGRLGPDPPVADP
jgi:hypothetical protein